VGNPTPRFVPLSHAWNAFRPTSYRLLPAYCLVSLLKWLCSRGGYFPFFLYSSPNCSGPPLYDQASFFICSSLQELTNLSTPSPLFPEKCTLTDLIPLRAPCCFLYFQMFVFFSSPPPNSNSSPAGDFPFPVLPNCPVTLS